MSPNFPHIHRLRETPRSTAKVLVKEGIFLRFLVNNFSMHLLQSSHLYRFIFREQSDKCVEGVGMLNVISGFIIEPQEQGDTHLQPSIMEG